MRLVDRSEASQELLGSVDGGARRRVEPPQIGKRVGARVDRAARSHRTKGKQRVREIRAKDLRLVVLVPRVEVPLREEAQRAPRTEPPRAPRALRRRCPRNLGDVERRPSGPRIVPRDARQPRIDDRLDPLDRDRSFRDIRRENDLLLRCRTKRDVLGFERQIAMERNEHEVPLGGDGRGALHRAPNFRGAGKKDEDIAARAALQELAHRARDLRLERARVGLGRVRHLDIELPPDARHDRRIQVRRHGQRIERRRHDDEPEIRARRPPQPLEQRERQISLQVPLVELVEHDGADAALLGIAEQPARQDSLRHELEPRRRPAGPLEPNFIADRISDALAPFFRHTSRREPRREPPRLEHDHLALDPRIEQRCGHPRRLARPGGRLQNQNSGRPHPLDDFAYRRVDRK